MMAILRYAFLKSWRDRSLLALMIWPVLGAMAPWMAFTIAAANGEPRPSPMQVAEILQINIGASAMVLGSIFAFWTFRGEIANRSIGAFLFPTRPLTIIASLILFATAGGVASTALATTVGAALFKVLPSSYVASFALRMLAFSFTAAAIGAMAVTISSQPTMLIGAIWGTCAVFLIPAIIKDSVGKSQRLGQQGISVPEYFAMFAVAILCAMIATVLLRRRCAT